MRLRVTEPVSHGQRKSWIGRAVDDRYVVIERIGIGATGDVYRAIQRSFGRQVAVKLQRSGGVRQRGFEEEARLLDLTAPGAVSVIDIGTTRCGVPYLVTELVDGLSLEEALRRSGPFDPRRAIRITLDLCRFLTCAHHLSIVHRDLKPANLMLAPDPTRDEAVKVIDFGLGTRCDRPVVDDIADAPPGLFGTPAYMAPEAIAGEVVSPASDVYSLGCVLFEMLAGRSPFGGTLPEVLAQHLYDSRPRLPDGLVPDGVRSLVTALLRRQPLLRPTAAEANEILAQFGG